MNGSNKPGLKIRKTRNRGLPLQERQRRIQLLIESGAIESKTDNPDEALPVDPQKLNWGWSGKITKTYFADIDFTCIDCGILQTWFKGV